MSPRDAAELRRRAEGVAPVADEGGLSEGTTRVRSRPTDGCLTRFRTLPLRVRSAPDAGGSGREDPYRWIDRVSVNTNSAMEKAPINPSTAPRN